MKTEPNMGSNIIALKNYIKDLMDYFKRLGVDIIILKNINNKLVERFRETERQCLENI